MMFYKRMLVFALCLSVASTVLLAAAPVRAQDEPDATTNYDLNLRAGPGKTHAVLAVLPANTGLFGEAVNDPWLLVHTADGAHRGWIHSLYLSYRPGFSMWSLPYSDEIIAGAAPPHVGAAPDAGANPVPDSASGQRAITLPANTIPGNTYTIFQRGLGLGNQRNVFIKIGDSVTTEQHFLEAFARGGYELGPYTYLQATIGYFGASNSFGSPSQTAASGYNSFSLMDAIWTNPNMCFAGEPPLDCEIRLKKPSIAIIYLGGNDLHMGASAMQFGMNLDQIVSRLIEKGVIPVLTTFAIAPDGTPNARFTYTMASGHLYEIRTLAARYGIPLIDFQSVAAALPTGGTLEDGYHLTFRGDRFIAFDGDEGLYGTVLRELMTLHMLHDLRVKVLGG
jgi:hypothetical protein